jgi:hypothetical protein
MACTDEELSITPAMRIAIDKLVVIVKQFEEKISGCHGWRCFDCHGKPIFVFDFRQTISFEHMKYRNGYFIISESGEIFPASPNYSSPVPPFEKQFKDKDEYFIVPINEASELTQEIFAKL